MELSDLISHMNRVVPQLQISLKRGLFERLSDIASEQLSIQKEDIFQALVMREKLGSTGVGDGIAIPHARIPGILKTYGLFCQLEKPIDFESLDNYPVDLVFLLLAPENSGADHLKALAKVARFFRDHGMCERLRHAKDKSELFMMLREESVSKAA